MTLLPIVERELRVAARRGGTFRSRWLMAFGALVLGAVIMAWYNYFSPGGFATQQNTGSHVFWWLAGLSLLYCVAAGRFSTADCLSVEKREGTLGLLFLTDLKGYDVVLGKMAATSVQAFYALLAVFPALAVPLLMGGVTNGEFWRVVLVLVDAFMFSLAIGIYASAVSRSYERATALNFYLIALFVVAPLAGMYIDVSFGGIPFPQLFFPCPAYALILGSAGNYPAETSHFWESVLTVHVLTWILIWRTVRIVPNSWRDESPVRGGKKNPGEFRRAGHYGGLRNRKVFRKKFLDINPILWLTSRQLNKPAQVKLFLGFVGFWWFVGYLVYGDDWTEQAVSLTTAIVLNLTFKLWVTMEAGDWLGRDKKAGAFELLLSTPLTPREMIRGQLMSLRRQFLGPLVVVIVVELLLMTTPNRSRQWDVMERCANWILGILLFLADLAALTWAAMYNSLISKNPALAPIKTVACILILPWLAAMAVTMGCGFLAMNLTGTFFPPGWTVLLAIMVVSSILVDVFFGVRAWRRLETEFRDLAAGYLDAKGRSK